MNGFFQWWKDRNIIVKIFIKLIVALGKGLISLTKAIINKFNKPKEAK